VPAPVDDRRLVRQQPAFFRTLYCGRQELAEFCHNNMQRAVLGLPGRDVVFVRARVREDQLRSHRPSYINAFLIASRGRVLRHPCTECQRKAASDPSGYSYPFPLCIKLPGHFGGCCANCKWPDAGSRCNERDEMAFDDRPARPALPPPRAPRLLGAPPGPGRTVDDPIDLDPEPGSEGNPIDLD
jgi:hypothetical protein